jgi:hypothetical protein
MRQLTANVMSSAAPKITEEPPALDTTIEPAVPGQIQAAGSLTLR